MARKLRIAASVFFAVVTVALAVVSGIGAFVAAMTAFISLGLKNYDNYEHYGSAPAVYVVYLAGAIGFLIPPGIAAWWLYKNGATFNVHRFSLRTLLIATTLVAVVLGLVVWAAGRVLAPVNCGCSTRASNAKCIALPRSAQHEDVNYRGPSPVFHQRPVVQAVTRFGTTPTIRGCDRDPTKASLGVGYAANCEHF